MSAERAPASALEQTLRPAYWLLLAVAAASGLAWLFGNVRLIPADSQAVVLRFGAIDRAQRAGLLLAWPSPLEEVRLLPAEERLQQRPIDRLSRAPEARLLDQAGIPLAQMNDAQAGSGYLLTGDLGVTQLRAAVYYRITDPAAYVRQGDLALPMLDKAVEAAAMRLCASRGLETIMATREAGAGAAVARERLRAELAQESNARLNAWKRSGAGIGVEVSRIDLQSTLPRAAQAAFDAVLSADQAAQRQLAQARTEAALSKQQAQAAVAEAVNGAQARAGERIAQARAETSEIQALAARAGGAEGAELLRQLYQQRMPGILAKAGKVTTVDPAAAGRLILPGESP